MSDAAHGVSEIPIVYVERDGAPLLAELYQSTDPAIAGTGLMLVDVHGGAFSSGNRYAGQYYCRALARAGIAVLSIEFRHGPDWQHPAALEDIAAAVKFCREGRTGYVPTQVGLIGSSSGGHLVTLAGIEPTDQGAAVDVDADLVIALWPVSNPAARYEYLHARQLESSAQLGDWDPFRLAEGHRGYFGSLAQMSAAAIQNVLTAGTFRKLPPLMIVQPALDENVPVFMSQTLQGAYRLAGGDATYRLYEGVGHGFAAAPSATTSACLTDIAAFISYVVPD